MKDSRDIDQLKLFPLPVVPRATVKGKKARVQTRRTTLSRTQGCVLEVLMTRGPMDDEQLQAEYDRIQPSMGWPVQRCVRKRRKDLVDAGRVKLMPEKRENAAGVMVKVWGIVTR